MSVETKRVLNKSLVQICSQAWRTKKLNSNVQAELIAGLTKKLFADYKHENPKFNVLMKQIQAVLLDLIEQRIENPGFKDALEIWVKRYFEENRAGDHSAEITEVMQHYMQACVRDYIEDYKTILKEYYVDAARDIISKQMLGKEEGGEFKQLRGAFFKWFEINYRKNILPDNIVSLLRLKVLSALVQDYKDQDAIDQWVPSKVTDYLRDHTLLEIRQLLLTIRQTLSLTLREMALNAVNQTQSAAYRRKMAASFKTVARQKEQLSLQAYKTYLYHTQGFMMSDEHYVGVEALHHAWREEYEHLNQLKAELKRFKWMFVSSGLAKEWQAKLASKDQEISDLKNRLDQLKALQPPLLGDATQARQVRKEQEEEVEILTDQTTAVRLRYSIDNVGLDAIRRERHIKFMGEKFAALKRCHTEYLSKLKLFEAKDDQVFKQHTDKVGIIPIESLQKDLQVVYQEHLSITHSSVQSIAIIALGMFEDNRFVKSFYACLRNIKDMLKDYIENTHENYNQRFKRYRAIFRKLTELHHLGDMLLEHAKILLDKTKVALSSTDIEPTPRLQSGLFKTKLTFSADVQAWLKKECHRSGKSTVIRQENCLQITLHGDDQRKSLMLLKQLKSKVVALVGNAALEGIPDINDNQLTINLRQPQTAIKLETCLRENGFKIERADEKKRGEGSLIRRRKMKMKGKVGVGS